MTTTAIFESIFKKDIRDENNYLFLQQVAQEHPYFSAAQFFLLQQTKKNTEDFKQQAAKTALYFNNPFWLNYLLTEELANEEQPLQNNTAAVLQNQKNIAEEAVHIAETVQVSDTTMLKNEPEAGTQKENTLELKPAQHIPVEHMLFEPMHMVDYFASQGIKLSEEVQTGDKLGKQLKSFTEWLKTMKKVHPDKLGQNIVQTDVAVQNLAEKSNTEGDILTEAMAEVFAMQGKNEKAIEVYEKLSLLNPLKSAYFAAKILPLKG